MGDHAIPASTGKGHSAKLEDIFSKEVSRRDLLKWGAVAAAGAIPIGAGCGSSGAGPPVPKHIILISMDTLRRDHLPVYGYSRNTAPGVSKLAESSVIFDNALAAASNTAPSHASMLTGVHPLTHGVKSNWAMLSPDAVTLAEILRGQGFAAGAFVSCIALHSNITGLDRGFDVYRQVGPAPGHCRARETFLDASAWLNALKNERRVFLFFHVFDPHFPYSAPGGEIRPEWEGSSRKRDLPLDYPAMRARMKRGFSQDEIQTYTDWYDEEILYADLYIERLLQTLRDKGMFDDSLVIFLSDHGETLGERPWMFDHGSKVYEEQIRIPLVIKFPGAWKKGTRIAAPVHHVDVTPTVLDALGLQPPESMEGVPLAPMVQKPEAAAERFMFCMAQSDPERTSELKQAIAPGEPVFCIRRPPHKLVMYPGEKARPVVCLHDLSSDPKEMNNTAQVHPVITGDLKRRLDAWISASLSKGRKYKTVPLSPEMDRALRSLGYIS